MEKGFEEDEPFSMLDVDDETVTAIKYRELRLLSLFIKHEIADIEEIMEERDTKISTMMRTLMMNMKKRKKIKTAFYSVIS